MSEEKNLSEEERREVMHGAMMRELDEALDLMLRYIHAHKDLVAPNGIVKPDVLLMMAHAFLEEHPSTPEKFWVTLPLFMICQAHNWIIPMSSTSRAIAEMTQEERDRFVQFVKDRLKEGDE